MEVMRSPELVGRAHELGFLTSALDRGVRDYGLLLVTGQAGVGKSRLADETAAAATARGFTVLTGRAADSASPVPYRPIAEALLRLGRSADASGRALAEVRHLLNPPSGGRGATRSSLVGRSPLILGEAVLRLLFAMDGPGSLLILEDLHFADPETLAIVEYLADNLAGEQSLCLATLRDDGSAPAQALGQALHARRSAAVLNLPRLNDAQAARLAASCLGLEAVPALVTERLIDRCDGLPFAIEEVLAAAVASGELVRADCGWQVNAGVGTAVPALIAASVRRRLAVLGRPAVAVIESAAVLGRRFDWRLLPAITGRRESDVLAVMCSACDAQLIEPEPPDADRFAFRHSLTREVIVSDLPLPARARRCADAVAVVRAAHPGLPGEWCELAAGLHEIAGQQIPAAELFVRAAWRAIGGGALVSARRCLRRAQDLNARIQPPDAWLAAGIGEALTAVHMHAGEYDQMIPAARRLLQDMDAIAAPAADKAMVCVSVARSLSEGDRVTAALRQIDVARQLAAQAPDPGLGGWVDAAAARCAIDAGDAGQAMQLARCALTSAEASGLAGHSAEAACEALEVIGRRERVRDTTAATRAFERAYQIATSRQLPFRQVRALHELGTIDLLETGGWQRLMEAKHLAARVGAGSVLAVLDLQLANAWSLGTDLERAYAAAWRCRQAAGRMGMRRMEAMASAVQACIMALRGRRHDAETLAGQARDMVPDDPEVQAIVWGEACVTAALADGDIAGAAAASATAISFARAEPLTAPSLTWGYWALLRAVTGPEGRAAVAEATAAGARVATWNRACISFAEAVLAGRGNEPRRASELAATGAEQLAACAPWWTHLMHWVTADAAFDCNWGNPTGWLRQAVPDLQANGFDKQATACRRTLRRYGQTVPRACRGQAEVPDHLRNLGITSREMDVLLLVEQNCSNTAVAQRLSISEKTVQTHLASLTAKTGLKPRQIADRAPLPTALDSADSVALRDRTPGAHRDG